MAGLETSIRDGIVPDHKPAIPSVLKMYLSPSVKLSYGKLKSERIPFIFNRVFATQNGVVLRTFTTPAKAPKIKSDPTVALAPLLRSAFNV